MFLLGIKDDAFVPLPPPPPEPESKVAESPVLAETPTKTRKRFALPFMDRSGSVSGRTKSLFNAVFGAIILLQF